jgi:uncharacterized protein YegL
MAPSDQVPFGDVSFAENPEPRCPCVLLLDVSGSMTGRPIEELNNGLQLYRDELAADALASKRVDIAVVTFGGRVEHVSGFSTADIFVPPTLTANGDTPMGQAIARGIELVNARKAEYRQNGIMYYRPWIFMITDGGPTDDWSAAGPAVRKGEEAKSFAFFAVGVQDANFDVLSKIAVREPLRLQGLRFRDLFQWLSRSQQAVSHSKVGEETPLENPTAPGGWAAV